MSLNCNEIDLVLSELSLDGAFIQDIIQPGYDTLALYTYSAGSAKTILICTAQNACRINETRRKITRNEKPLRFMELLKSRIKGTKINKCRQIEKQRIICFELSNAQESFLLYVRLWSGAANVILCNTENKIIDSLYRRPKKGEVTGSTFTLPETRPETRVWPVREFSEIHPSAQNPLSFNEKVDLWYGEYAENLSREALLEKAEKWYESSKSKMENALENLIKKQNEFENAEDLKHIGDLISANAHLLTPSSPFLECEDFKTGKTIKIHIDPTKDAYKNAAYYYEKCKKAKTGAASLEHDIDVAKKRIEKLTRLYAEMQREMNPVKIEQLLRKNTATKQQQKKEHPGLDYTVDGWYILVGRDANENDELLRHYAKGNDLWLHTRDFPGGYVFIKNRQGKSVPLEILLYAANLAVYYSKARNAGKVDLYYTSVKHLRRAKNAPKGTVLPTNEKNLCITPDKKRLEWLDSLKKEMEMI
ncbi:MAG: NFACT family protein [Treponemataceae bacterium]|nr:NFACT family protein [Treponemataceae bacterium]